MKRCKGSSDASSMGVCDVPSPSTIFAIGGSRCSTQGPAPSHPRVRKAWSDLHLLLGGVLERLIRRQHDRDGAHALMGGVDAGGRFALLDQGLGGAHQPMARHNDAVVG